MDSTLASIRSETVELIDTAIERSRATTHEFILAQFQQLGATLGPHRGQPPPPTPANDGTQNRDDRNTTPVYDARPYLFDDAATSRPSQFDDSSLSRSLRTQGPTFTADSQFQDFRREHINFLRAVNPAFPELLEGAPPPDAAANTAYRNFQHKMFGYLCVVMKHPTAAMALSNFQRDPSFSTRVSPGSDAWRALIDLFDQRGIGRTVSLLTKLMEPQGDRENIDAYLQRMLHCYQDINEDEQMVNEKLLVAATLHNLNNKLSSARASIIAALDARQDGQAATSVPFTLLCTMLIQHNSHTSFPGHQPATTRHGLYDPRAFNSAVEAAVEEALAARADSYAPKRGPPPLPPLL